MATAPEAKRAQETQASEQSETSRPRVVAAQVAQDIRTASEATVEAGVRTTGAAADVMRDLTRRAADQSQEALRFGLHAVTAAQAPLADVGYDQSRRFVETTARVTDVYFDAVQRTADDVHALVGSCSTFGRGLQQYQHAYLDMLTRSMEGVSRKRQDMYRVKSPVEFAEAQRDMYMTVADDMFKGSAALLQIAGQIAKDAMRPLQQRAETLSAD